MCLSQTVKSNYIYGMILQWEVCNLDYYYIELDAFVITNIDIS